MQQNEQGFAFLLLLANLKNGASAGWRGLASQEVNNRKMRRNSPHGIANSADAQTSPSPIIFHPDPG